MADGMQSERSIGRGRSVAFALVALLLAVGLAEGAARALEPVLFPYRRSIPIPSPMAPGALELQTTMNRARSKVSQTKPPDWAERLPLVASEELGWSLPPGGVFSAHGAELRINTLGMRGPELTPKAANELRLFTLGDSSIFGDGVGENQVFSTVAAGILTETWGRSVTGIIGGVPGHDSGQSLARLKQLGSAVQPDWVIIGNLWSDVYRAGVKQGEDAFGYLPPVQERLRGLALYRLLRRAYSPWLAAREVRWLVDAKDVGQIDGPIGTRVSLESYVRNLKAMAAEARGLGARTAFLMLPAPMDLDVVPPPDTVTRFRLAMEAVAEDLGAPILKGPALFKAEGATLVYFKDQVHPSQEGHALLGLGLAELLGPEGPGAAVATGAEGEVERE